MGGEGYLSTPEKTARAQKTLRAMTSTGLAAMLSHWWISADKLQYLLHSRALGGVAVSVRGNSN